MGLFSRFFKRDPHKDWKRLDIQTKRPGWPTLKIKRKLSPAQQKEILSILKLETDYEERIEKITSDPYQRLVVLLFVNGTKPQEPEKIPLDKPLYDVNAPYFTESEHGFDNLSFIEVTLRLGDLLGIELDEEKICECEPVVIAIADMVRKLVEK